MSEIHVLVIFSCQTGAVERLALAAAVGAVQARASIRLRRVVDPSKPQDVEAERMNREYVAPRDGDIAWADGVILAVPGHVLESIDTLGQLVGKPAASLIDCTLDGLNTVEIADDSVSGMNMSPERARLLGRRVVETALARR